ncbi:hypothetical protein ccbrp13_24600 [Ktedonobacteria bacterium brp13]|nr:hypothetical protein ccbrp13_24600 [Ktedonobacteria bacterium brp13]
MVGMIVIQEWLAGCHRVPEERLAEIGPVAGENYMSHNNYKIARPLAVVHDHNLNNVSPRSIS